MAKTKKGGLGKGLDALFVDNSTVSENIVTLRLSDIEPNKEQPRKDFNSEALAELADSIREHGLIQPLVVRPIEKGYKLVAGERRWRASRMIGVEEVPVVIKEMNDKEAMEIALIENVQREDLNIIEEALGYEQLIDKYNMTQEILSKRVGKSRPVIANALRLLNLPKEVIEMVKSNQITAGHARALLRLEDEKIIIEVAKRIIKDNLSVRDVEKIGKQLKEPESELIYKEEKSSFCKEAEIALSEMLGRRVQVVKSRNKNVLQIDFFDEEDLSFLLEKFNED